MDNIIELKDLEAGDKVWCGGDSGFCHNDIEEVDVVGWKFDEDTGERYKVIILSSGQRFDSRDGSPLTPPTAYYIQPTDQGQMKMRLIFKYTSAGVELDKIRMSNKTALTLWSLSGETIVGENGKPSPYIKGDELRQVNFHVRTELSKEEVDNINNSKGIIISSEQRDDFRYGYIPEN